MDRPLAPEGWRSRRHRWAKGMLPVALLGMVVTLTGCTSGPTVRAMLEPYQQTGCRHWTETKARFRANSIWAEKYAHCYGSRNHARDIKQGFVDGFVDTAMGGNGCPPMMAPASYSGLWMFSHRQPVAARWFEGYPLGVVAAESCGVHGWHQSRLNPQLLACMGDRGCNPGCRPCQPNTCGCGRQGCGGNCGTPEILYGSHAVESTWLPSEDAVLVEDGLAPLSTPNPEAPASLDSDDLPIPREEDLPTQRLPSSAPESAMAPKLTRSDVFPIAASAGIQPSDVTQAVTTDSVEMPNMQVRFDLEDSGWMFGEIEVARSLLQIKTTGDRSESDNTNSMH